MEAELAFRMIPQNVYGIVQSLLHPRSLYQLGVVAKEADGIV